MVKDGSKDKTRSRFWPMLLLLILVVAGSQCSGDTADPYGCGPAARADMMFGDSNDVRLQRAVNLLRAGYGKTVLLDERTDQVQFGRTQAEAAEEFIARRHLENVEVCPGQMASTDEEVEFAAPCLQSRHAPRILLVTSAYHTRRALAIFRYRLPQYEWSVAAAQDESAYGGGWWRRRAWAKTLYDSLHNMVGRNREISLLGGGGPLALRAARSLIT